MIAVLTLGVGMFSGVKEQIGNCLPPIEQHPNILNALLGTLFSIQYFDRELFCSLYSALYHVIILVPVSNSYSAGKGKVNQQ